MPKILSFTPAWLSNPSIGHKLFTQDISSSNGNIPIDLKNGRFSQQSSFSGARRTVARRGAEVFVAVGKEIRWVDLAVQKKRFEGEHERPDSRLSLDFGSEDGSQGYKVCVTLRTLQNGVLTANRLSRQMLQTIFTS
jgi:nucleoporin NUP82